MPWPDASAKASLPSLWEESEDLEDEAFFLLLETTVKKDLDGEYPESAEPEATLRPEEDEEEDESETDEEEAEGDEESSDEEEGEEDADEEGDGEESAQEEEAEVRPCTPRADVLSCLTKMKAAYEAHMEFARYSLSVIRESHPQDYERTMASFRKALRRQYCRDLDSLRAANLWSPGSAHPENDAPRGDAFVNGSVRNASGFGVRGQSAYHIKHRKEMVKLRQNFIAELMQNRTLAGLEYLSDCRFEPGTEEVYYEPKPTPHSKELLRLFRRAENRWWKYATDGAMAYHCGDCSLVGSDTHLIAYFDVIFRLWDHHEDFLLELLNCFHPTEE